MSKRTRTQVVVIGAGPAGMVAALRLKNHGVRVEVFDALPGPSCHSYALALHPRSLALLESLDLRTEVEKHARLVRGMSLTLDGTDHREIDFARAGLMPAYLAVTGQATLEEVLASALREAGVPIHWNHRVNHITCHNHELQVTVAEMEERTTGYAVGHLEQFVRRELEYECSFVVGADGPSSFLRNSLEIDFPEVAPPQYFSVFEFKGKGGDSERLRLFSRDGLISARWPLGDDLWRWSFEIPEEAVALFDERRKTTDVVQLLDQTVPGRPDREQLATLLDERAPTIPTEVDHLYWRLLIRFERRLAKRFGGGQMWLVGDAAHTAGPVGSQSMNVGLREGSDLADRIAAILKMRATLDSLEEYNAERMAEWEFLLGGKAQLHSVNNDNPLPANVMEQLLGWLPGTGSELVAMAHELGVAVEHAAPVPA